MNMYHLTTLGCIFAIVHWLEQTDYDIHLERLLIILRCIFAISHSPQPADLLSSLHGQATNQSITFVTFGDSINRSDGH